MSRTLTLSETGAEEFVLAMLKNDLENLNSELSGEKYPQHPDDKKYCKKMRKALIRVINHFSSPSDRIAE